MSVRIARAALLIGLVALAAGGAALRLRSPGVPPPLRGADEQVIPGSLSERVMLEIGGVTQGLFIQSADPANPVLLFLHGGPAMPELFLNATHPTDLERAFTVVWWEQRGAGISWSPGLDPKSLTVERLVEDAVEVADYLRSRFGQDRIYLLGHSWGSFLGIQVAARAPDRFHAYIGMAQVVHQLESEELAHAAMLDAYRARGDTAMVRRLEAAHVSVADGMSPAYLRLRDTAMHRLGAGTTRDMRSVVSGVFLPSWWLPAYTLREKVNLWRAKAWSRRLLWERFLVTDLRTRVTRLDLPVHFFVGRHDLTALPALSRAYFDAIDAPVKGFYLFENSAHGPLFEEPERARRILVEDIVGASQAAVPP